MTEFYTGADVALRSSAFGNQEDVMAVDDVKARLHGALHRHPKATEDEVEAIATVVLAIVGELTAELAIVIADLAARVEALETRA
jgi:hypothetical protein